MVLTRLLLTDFRNHARFELPVAPGLIVLHGPNGTGKTNILEAVSMLVPGRGLRRVSLSQMARHGGAGGFAISAEMGDVRLGTGTEPAAPDRRKVRINGANAAANNLAEWLSVLWITPAMDRIFTEGAGGRRRFLDRLVLALKSDHARLSGRYEAAMRERNLLLAGEMPPDPVWLDAIEVRMAEAAIPIAEARARLVTTLDENLAGNETGPFANPALTLEQTDANDPETLLAAWRDGRARDAAAGRTLTGPHRADLVVMHRAKEEAAARCSTGEQKALLLSIVLAHAEMVAEQGSRRPILLLDEVAAHLDPSRRAALFGRLSQMGGQVWMTGTEAGLFDAIGDGAQMVGL
ncbi:MAG: DNA replication/repair protein RecF [Sphingorhabdus sp.]